MTLPRVLNDIVSLVRYGLPIHLHKQPCLSQLACLLTLSQKCRLAVAQQVLITDQSVLEEVHNQLKSSFKYPIIYHLHQQELKQTGKENRVYFELLSYCCLYHLLYLHLWLRRAYHIYLNLSIAQIFRSSSEQLFSHEF